MTRGKIMKVYHYFDSHLTQVDNIKQTGYSEWKPQGLWVSDCDAGLGWYEWCKSEEFREDFLRKRTILELDVSKVLHIKTVRELDSFHEEYREEIFPEYYGINWVKVSKRHSGILISPYQYKRRLDGPSHNWYCGWDCASGCIWDSKAVLSLEPDLNWNSSPC